MISTNGWMDETYRSASSFKPKWPASETLPTITDVPKNCCSILFSDFENLPAMKYFEGSEYDVHLLS